MFVFRYSNAMNNSFNAENVWKARLKVESETISDNAHALKKLLVAFGIEIKTYIIFICGTNLTRFPRIFFGKIIVFLSRCHNKIWKSAIEFLLFDVWALAWK